MWSPNIMSGMAPTHFGPSSPACSPWDVPERRDSPTLGITGLSPEDDDVVSVAEHPSSPSAQSPIGSDASPSFLSARCRSKSPVDRWAAASAGPIFYPDERKSHRYPSYSDSSTLPVETALPLDDDHPFPVVSEHDEFLMGMGGMEGFGQNDRAGPPPMTERHSPFLAKANPQALAHSRPHRALPTPSWDDIHMERVQYDRERQPANGRRRMRSFEPRLTNQSFYRTTSSPSPSLPSQGFGMSSFQVGSTSTLPQLGGFSLGFSSSASLSPRGPQYGPYASPVDVASPPRSNYFPAASGMAQSWGAGSAYFPPSASPTRDAPHRFRSVSANAATANKPASPVQEPAASDVPSREHPHGEHPSRTLFIRNIDSAVPDQELLELFEAYGPVRSVYSLCKHRGFIMVSYYDLRHAKIAIRSLQGREVHQRKLDIHYSIPKDNPSEKDYNQGTLVVFNLDPHISQDELCAVFGQHGEIKEIRETPNKRHHRFIEFYDIRSAEEAMNTLNRSEIHGKRIKIEVSRPGGRRNSSSDDTDSPSPRSNDGPWASPGPVPLALDPNAFPELPSATKTTSDPRKTFARTSSAVQVNQRSPPKQQPRTCRAGRSISLPPSEHGKRGPTSSARSKQDQFVLSPSAVRSGRDLRTTLMIKNIPNKYSQKMLLNTVDETHQGCYDFIYLPIDFKNKCNVGYAFINFIDAKDIVSFYERLHNTTWVKFNSEKVCHVTYARIQGKEALIAHFQNSSLMTEDKKCRPIIFHSTGPKAGQQAVFPVGATRQRPKEGKSQGKSRVRSVSCK